jgi:hypothetical protein
MLIDCGTCPVRGEGCSGCLVTALFDPPKGMGRLNREESWAVEVLSRAGFEVTVLDQQRARERVPLIGRRHTAA